MSKQIKYFKINQLREVNEFLKTDRVGTDVYIKEIQITDMGIYVVYEV